MKVRTGISLGLACALALAASGLAGGLYDLDGDEERGPAQPIDFSHKKHAGELEIQCLYCHTAADKSQHATVPAVSVCMGCHQWVKKGASPGSEDEIAKIGAYMEKGESIPWIRVHNLPEYVQFNHQPHVRHPFSCQTCHGPVREMNRIWLVPDTRYSPSSAFLPAQKLEMGWCVDCHEQNEGPRGCVACHY